MLTIYGNGLVRLARINTSWVEGTRARARGFDENKPSQELIRSYREDGIPPGHLPDLQSILTNLREEVSPLGLDFVVDHIDRTVEGRLKCRLMMPCDGF